MSGDKKNQRVCCAWEDEGGQMEGKVKDGDKEQSWQHCGIAGASEVVAVRQRAYDSFVTYRFVRLSIQIQCSL